MRYTRQIRTMEKALQEIDEKIEFLEHELLVSKLRWDIYQEVSNSFKNPPKPTPIPKKKLKGSKEQRLRKSRDVKKIIQQLGELKIR